MDLVLSMAYNPAVHHRRSIRLKGYDYSQPGGYFVTMVTWQRMNLLGGIINGEASLTLAGQCVQARLLAIPNHFHARLDAWVIMPNHVHAVIFLEEGEPQTSLPAIIQFFKSVTARQIKSARNVSEPVWQKNYYEHVIRQDGELDTIRRYIHDNPCKWTEDREYQPDPSYSIS